MRERRQEGPPRPTRTESGRPSIVLARDELFTSDVAREAAALKLSVIEVDLGATFDGLVNRVGEGLGLGTR
jgi:hypothetical protein